MQASRLILAAALTAAAFVAQAESPDLSGQFAHRVSSGPAAQVATRPATQSVQSTVSPWSTQYNPLATFRSTKTRAEVQAEYIANRDAVAAMNREDSGSAYLAAHRTGAASQLAGTPANAQ
ncbi:MAG: hypothetical protein JWP65_2171 [Ramlibacter sp.]|uniref:hypothetical protein n=1 Tax=Ramlibacter sp. TaxID=1917967 RepID=UPI00261ACAB5|nr:hypothetical protein [Ramlibacter sp.]MDB5751750.1 hypothetical protein [Ramlibacter sp.]